LKQHLAGTKKMLGLNVVPWVRQGDTTGEKEKEKELDDNIFKKIRISTQTTINNIFKKNLREKVCLEIITFFYNNDIFFN
ncbi:hypothetical protein S245_031552, partial [Arachis hypogaea]